jgi:hypothetical protein
MLFGCKPVELLGAPGLASETWDPTEASPPQRASEKLRTTMKLNPRVADGAEFKWLTYSRESSQIQFTSHVLPPSGENDCSIRADCGEMFSQT